MRGLLVTALVVGVAMIWLLLDQKQVEPPTPTPRTNVTVVPVQEPVAVGPAQPVTSKQPPPASSPDDDEPDPYPINEITLPPEGYGDSAHPVASDIRTGADDDEDLAEKLGSAYVPEEENAAEDGSRFTQQ